MESIGLVKKVTGRTSLVVQRLGLSASKAGGSGSIPGQLTKIPHAVWYSQKKKKKSSLGLCHNILQKNPNELLGQPNICLLEADPLPNKFLP